MPIAAGRLRALIPATTSIDAIIERTGGSKRTIYSEFGSKEGLFLALVADNADRAISALSL
ncbi:MAG: helix-turn-helix transcriptional regulator, partial [Ochrobactrum anthropi]